MLSVSEVLQEAHMQGFSLSPSLLCMQYSLKHSFFCLGMHARSCLLTLD